MSILSGVSNFFGLDIGTSAIRVVELRGKGPVKTLAAYAQGAVDEKIALSDAKADQQRLVQVIKDIVKQAGISTHNVAVGLPSSRVFTTVVDFDRLGSDELAKTIRYQAESLIPTPISDSKIDWAVIGDSPKDTTKVEILLTSVPNNFVENRLDMLEEAGFNVIAFEPDSMAVMRSIIPFDTTAPQMVLDVGNKATDLVISVGGAPRLSRSIPTGIDAIVRSAMQNLSIDQKQANQFVFKFGLGKDKLEGQIYNAIISTVDLLMAEVEKSVKFFHTRYGDMPIEKIYVTGGASVLPEFPLYLNSKSGIGVEIGNAWRNINFPASKQNELLSISNHFGVAVGLAERIE